MKNTNDPNKEIHQEVQEVLSQHQDKITFEELPDQQSSPLNQAVVDKGNPGTKESVEIPPSTDISTAKTENAEKENAKTIVANEHPSTPANPSPPKPKDDAPEQEINEDYADEFETAMEKEVEEEKPFELPLSHAKQAADTAMGIANNIIEVGGGYFVKIRKHKDFYEFEEIITVIEKQNEKNVQRIKLDKEDQLLLRPLLIQVLKTKAQKLTPEQQLLGAFLSIGMKKVQIGMEVRHENEILVERILDIIRAEKGEESEESNTKNTEQKEEIANVEDQAVEEETTAEVVSETTDQQVMVIPPLAPTIRPEQVMEVAMDHAEVQN